MANKNINTDAGNQSCIDNPVDSPCIGVCVLDMEDVCEGCFRSMDEISRWSSMTPDAQREVIKLGWQRAKASGKFL